MPTPTQSPEPEPPPVAAGDTIHYDQVAGYVQKGPFLNGTALQLSELRKDLSPTGKVFTGQLLDNQGTFSIRNVDLVSQYVQLQATGFYFNEVSNTNSSAQLTLYALSDLRERSALNVNLLSTLERSRAEYLIGQGVAFAEAKSQAHHEILDIFEMDAEQIVDSESLDITRPGEANAKLLALSLILQGYLNVSELSELVANINTDIREDGYLNSGRLGSTLVNNAVALPLADIRKQLQDRYALLGLSVVIPPFEVYVKQFIARTDFEFTDHIRYPAVGAYGPNLLDTNQVLQPGKYSLLADLSRPSSVKVVISGPNWYFPAFQTTGWTFTQLYGNVARDFTASGRQVADFEINFAPYSPHRQCGETPPNQPPYNPPGNDPTHPDSTTTTPPPAPPTSDPRYEPCKPDTTWIQVYENGSDTITWQRMMILSRE